MEQFILFSYPVLIEWLKFVIEYTSNFTKRLYSWAQQRSNLQWIILDAQPGRMARIKHLVRIR